MKDDDFSPWISSGQQEHDAHILAYLMALEQAEFDERYAGFSPASKAAIAGSRHLRDVVDMIRSGPRRPPTDASLKESLQRLRDNEKKGGS